MVHSVGAGAEWLEGQDRGLCASDVHCPRPIRAEPDRPAADRSACLPRTRSRFRVPDRGTAREESCWQHASKEVRTWDDHVPRFEYRGRLRGVLRGRPDRGRVRQVRRGQHREGPRPSAREPLRADAAARQPDDATGRDLQAVRRERRAQVVPPLPGVWTPAADGLVPELRGARRGRELDPA